MEKLQLLESVLGHGDKTNRDYYQFYCPFCSHRDSSRAGKPDSRAQRCGYAGKFVFLLCRRADRHVGRRASRAWSGHNDGDAAAPDILPVSGVRIDHARWNLLRRAVWWLDNGHSGQFAGRGVLGQRQQRRAGRAVKMLAHDGKQAFVDVARL